MKRILFLVLLAMVLLVSGCYGPKTEPAAPPGQNSVNIENFVFNPATITVQKGTTVTWTQMDSAPHTITGNGFDSGTLNKGQTFSWTFNEAGTFSYKCSFHPAMSGEVIVK